jgi:two-component system sensor histidine kinase AlgZ
MFALLAGAGLLAYFNLRARALSPAITEARLQALQARIRPHFLFNSLNAVLSLVRSDPRRAERALENMADLFRALMGDARQLAPLEDEVALPAPPGTGAAAPRRPPAGGLAHRQNAR